MKNFKEQLLDRIERLILTFISKKYVWTIVATVLLIKKYITPDIWMLFVGSIIGIGEYVKVKTGDFYSTPNIETDTKKKNKYPQDNELNAED